MADPLWLRLGRMDHRLRRAWVRCLPAALSTALYSGMRSRFLKQLDVSALAVAPAERPVALWGKVFRNDLGNAAGMDKDGSLLPFHYALGAGFAVVGTALDRPHTGNLWRGWNPWTPLPHSRSALNSLGLPSKGIDAALDQIKAFQDTTQPVDFPIGLSIMGHPLEDEQEKLAGVLRCIEKATPVVDFIELNESCPNVAHEQGDLSARLKTVIEARDAVGTTPLLVKLGQITDPESLVPEMVKLGVNGIVATNTQKDYAVYRPAVSAGDQCLFDYYTRQHGGGISGALIAEFAYKQVAAAARCKPDHATDFHFVHVGGIGTPEDVARSRTIAPLREWYTGFFDALFERGPERLYAEMVGVQRS